MKIQIKSIYSQLMFPGLIMGRANEVLVEDLPVFQEILALLNPHPQSSLINDVKIEWTQFEGESFGSYGHICGVNAQINDDESDKYTMYTITVMFNFLPETESLQEKLKEVLIRNDYKGNAFMWDIGDL